jgi:hypothetical protein
MSGAFARLFAGSLRSRVRVRPYAGAALGPILLIRNVPPIRVRRIDVRRAIVGMPVWIGRTQPCFTLGRCLLALRAVRSILTGRRAEQCTRAVLGWGLVRSVHLVVLLSPFQVRGPG